MFDNPKKELARLQRELLEEDKPEADPEEAFYEMKEFLSEEDSDEVYREPLVSRYARFEEEPEEYVDEPPVQIKKERKKGGIRGLITAVILEALAIIGLLAWWFLW